MSLTTGVFPHSLKKARVTPIPNGGALLNVTKFLGIHIDKKLNFVNHITEGL